jgi:DNA polymerase-3 subunit alpha
MSETASTSGDTPRFVHLHTHSHYSLLNALPTPKELAKAAKEDGQSMRSLLTDNGALYGDYRFLQSLYQRRD